MCSATYADNARNATNDSQQQTEEDGNTASNVKKRYEKKTAKTANTAYDKQKTSSLLADDDIDHPADTWIVLGILCYAMMIGVATTYTSFDRSTLLALYGSIGTLCSIYWYYRRKQ